MNNHKGHTQEAREPLRGKNLQAGRRGAITNLKKKILPILKKNKVKKAGIFGSYARGDYNKNSDIDILVRVNSEWSLLDLVGLELELKKILGKDVDLLTYNGIHPLLKNIILKEEIRII